MTNDKTNIGNWTISDIKWKLISNGFPLDDQEILVYSKKLKKCMIEYVDSEFFIRKENLNYTHYHILN